MLENLWQWRPNLLTFCRSGAQDCVHAYLISTSEFWRSEPRIFHPTTPFRFCISSGHIKNLADPLIQMFGSWFSLLLSERLTLRQWNHNFHNAINIIFLLLLFTFYLFLIIFFGSFICGSDEIPSIYQSMKSTNKIECVGFLRSGGPLYQATRQPNLDLICLSHFCNDQYLTNEIR